MTDRPSAEDDMRCIDFVRVVSTYVDGELDEAERARIERHLEGCQGCQAAIDQFETVIRLAGRWRRTPPRFETATLCRDW